MLFVLQSGDATPVADSVPRNARSSASNLVSTRFTVKVVIL